jgi:hypothetical protein
MRDILTPVERVHASFDCLDEAGFVLQVEAACDLLRGGKRFGAWIPFDFAQGKLQAFRPSE